MQLKKLMIEVMVFFVLGCFLCACGKTKDQTRKTTKDANKEIMIGGDNYPPFNYTDENGNLAGVTGRENDYHWAGPYMLSRQVIAVNDSSKINKLSDLKNKIIAVQSTTKPEELFLKQTDSKIPKVKQVYSMENRELIYTSLSRGYVDAIAAHEISIRQYMSDFEAKYRILDEDILETGIGVAFAKNDKRGIEKELSKTLKAMVKDGSAKKILQKYVPDAEKYLEVNSLER